MLMLKGKNLIRKKHKHFTPLKQEIGAQRDLWLTESTSTGLFVNRNKLRLQVT
ncbi:uncharacterized protein METZ01_LOCUS226797 [marine metagenome]|uniref:Uncharacterized protein n=1 Tax=marine metagenome TaxID=408172 RepID=A0A382GH29_9ZZZZ